MGDDIFVIADTGDLSVSINIEGLSDLMDTLRSPMSAITKISSLVTAMTACCCCNLQDLSATLYFVMGALAKMAATFVTYPIQLVQSRLRVFLSFFSRSLVRIALWLVVYLVKDKWAKLLGKFGVAYFHVIFHQAHKWVYHWVCMHGQFSAMPTVSIGCRPSLWPVSDDTAWKTRLLDCIRLY